MSDRMHVFIDENGNTSLSVDKEGTSPYFILIAATIFEKDLNLLRLAINDLRLKYVQGACLESKKIGNDSRKRTQILADIVALDSFRYHALIVDKGALERTGGLKFKASFYKYFNRKLYEQIIKYTLQAQFIADKYGSQEFMDQFKDYLHERLYDGGLFAMHEEPQIAFSAPEEEVLLSISDIIAGTWGKIYSQNTPPEYKAQWKKLLLSRAINIETWPLDLNYIRGNLGEEVGQYDDYVRELSLERVRGFMEEKHDSKEDKDRLRADVLEFLLSRQMFSESDQRIFAGEIVGHLRTIGYQDIDENQLRYDVIGPLRNLGILISSGRKGYKIALSEKDIREYVEYGQSYVLPILSRLKTAALSVKSTTNGKLDILADFPKLRNAIEKMPDL